MAEPLPAYPTAEPQNDLPPDFPDLAGATSSQIRDESAYDGISFQFGRSYNAIGSSIQVAFRKVQQTSRQLAEERPLHLVTGVAIAGFAAGAFLRIWRSRYA